MRYDYEIFFRFFYQAIYAAKQFNFFCNSRLITKSIYINRKSIYIILNNVSDTMILKILQRRLIEIIKIFSYLNLSAFLIAELIRSTIGYTP